jgi:hypothetical protein
MVGIRFLEATSQVFPYCENPYQLIKLKRHCN